MRARATMRAYCQHCDQTELIAPEEIYSPAFNFWCPRCQSILILQDDGSALLAPPSSAAQAETITRIDREAVLDPRQAPTKEDDEPPTPAPIDVTIGEPEPKGERETTSYDPYRALAAELDAGIAADEMARPTTRLPSGSRQRDVPPTTADPEGPDHPSTAAPNGSASLKDMAALARKLDPEKGSTRRTPPPSPRPSGLADSGPVVARETVRVTRSSVGDAARAALSGPAKAPSSRENARREIEQRLTNGIAPGLPPLPNWDGGDTQQVRELASQSPPPPQDEPLETPDADDALEKLAVVETAGGTTTGTGSRTYERVEGEAAPAAEPAPAPPQAAKGPSEDLDWYALLDEALPDAEGDVSGEDSSRVVIRLPETMAPQNEADAEQVRQLQAKLEARSVHGDPAETGQVQKLDSKKVRELADDADAGHSAVKEDETKDYHPKKDDDETKDNPGREGKADPDAPTRAADPERTAQLRSEDGAATAKTESQHVRRSDTGPTPSDRKRAPVSAGAGVIEQFNRSDLDPGLVCARDSSSPEADYFKQLYQRIFHSRNGSSPRVVLVTSASKGEGKTTVAANLALVAARMPGRGALLVEADPRGGDLLRSFGLRMKAEGLLEALESGKDPSGYILQFKLGMLDVLPLGVPGSDAAELISSDRIGEVVRGLAVRYPTSVVIIDGSSILHAPDPLVLARHVDGVVLVVRADVTPREHIERARDLIGPEKVLGVVLNQAG